MTKDDFNILWKDSTRAEILNQYYYDYKEMVKLRFFIKQLKLALEILAVNEEKL